MVGRHAVAKNSQRARALDFADCARLHRETVEERRFLDVRGLGIPFIDVAGAGRDFIPLGILRGEILVKLAKHFRLQRGLHEVADFVQESARDPSSKTGWPSLPVPSGSVFRSMSTRPASANATTSGGDMRKFALMF